jgi:hypothetical protein
VQMLAEEGRALKPKGIPDSTGVSPLRVGQLLLKIWPGRILVHNEVDHSVNATCGRNGFRAWTQSEPAPEGFVKCGRDCFTTK